MVLVGLQNVIQHCHLTDYPTVVFSFLLYRTLRIPQNFSQLLMNHNLMLMPPLYRTLQIKVDISVPNNPILHLAYANNTVISLDICHAVVS